MDAGERSRLVGAVVVTLVVAGWFAGRWMGLLTRRRRAVSDLGAALSAARRLVRDIVGLTASLAGMLLVGALLVTALVAGCVASH